MITATVRNKLSQILSFNRTFFCSRGKLRSVMTDKSSPDLHEENIKKIENFIPKLTPSLHKGQCGRVGIIGGSAEYTGAPYFAAISALKTGADLVYVFCCQAAAPVIKSYSPELIVSPVLDSVDIIAKIDPWLQRLHALVIGPGLGRDPDLLQNVEKIINHCKENTQPCLPLIIDADGLFLINENPSLIQNYKGPVVLTPNAAEFNRLKIKLSSEDSTKIATMLNAVLVLKGSQDQIINGIHNVSNSTSMLCDVQGSDRRCGGQGDILAGCLSTFVVWFRLHRGKNYDLDFSQVNCNFDEEIFDEKFLGYSLAAYAACALTRTCSRLAFEQFGRGMTATNMIPLIHKVFRIYFYQ